MPALTSLADLSQALKIEQGELVALVGGGGKTTTLFALGEQLAGTTVLTTTTKMGAEQSEHYRTLLDPTDEELRRELSSSGRALAWKAADARRAIGVSAQTCDRWFDIADNVVVEADGSRKRPFKAPASHEPVIPARTTLLIACVGASAFGRPIEDACHRPQLVAGIAECDVGDTLTPARAAAVLLNENGSQKGRPADARFAVVLCRVDPDQRATVDELTEVAGAQIDIIAVADSSV